MSQQEAIATNLTELSNGCHMPIHQINGVFGGHQFHDSSEVHLIWR
jgi:hypothetical protein